MAGFIYEGFRVSLSTDSGDAYLTFHLHLATDRRFKENAGFFVTLAGTGDDGGVHRDSFWFHPSVPIRFFYDDAEPVDLDRAYADELFEESKGVFGIHLGDTNLFVAQDLPDDEAAQSDAPPERTGKVW